MERLKKGYRWVNDRERRNRRLLIVPFLAILVIYVALLVSLAATDGTWRSTDTFTGIAGLFFFAFGTALAVMLELRQEDAQRIQSQQSEILERVSTRLDRVLPEGGLPPAVGRPSEPAKDTSGQPTVEVRTQDAEPAGTGIQTEAVEGLARGIEAGQISAHPTESGDTEERDAKREDADPGDAEREGAKPDDAEGDVTGRGDPEPAMSVWQVLATTADLVGSDEPPALTAAAANLRVAADPANREPLLQLFAVESAIEANADGGAVKRLLEGCKCIYVLGMPAGDTSVPGKGTESDILHFELDEADEQTFMPVFTRSDVLARSVRRNPEWGTLSVLELDGGELVPNIDADVALVIDPWSKLEFQIPSRDSVGPRDS